MRSFLSSIWRDLRALPLNLMRGSEALIITALLLLPWLILFLEKWDWTVLQPLIWIFAFIAYYWVIGHWQAPAPLAVRRLRLELLVALGLVGLWILYRIGEYWHWYAIPAFGLSNTCGPISETPIPKMVEMFLVPGLFLLVLKYALRQIGISLDKFSFLAALAPILALLAFGLMNHSWGPFAVSSACYFFGAGLPEEFLYRAFLQTRIEAALRRPLWAVWLAAFAFGLSHLPIDLGGSFLHWQDALITAFTYQMTVGFALGYAYQKVRSVLPLSILHTLIDSAL